MSVKELIEWLRKDTEEIEPYRGHTTFLHRESLTKIVLVGKSFKIYLNKQNIFTTASIKKLIDYYGEDCLIVKGKWINKQ